MSKKIQCIAVVLILGGVWIAYAQQSGQKSKAQSSKAQPKTTAKAGQSAPSATKDQASYGIGLRLGQNLTANGVDAQTVNLEMLVRGMLDALQGRQQAFTDAQLEQALTTFETEMQQKFEQRQQALSQKNLQEGQAFLAKNKTRPEVSTLPSGLQYQVLKQGTGASPKKTDTVRVHYHGTLIDGTVFDSSVERNQPASFRLDEVIPGWTEAVQRMKVGGKWRLYLPPELAYGAAAPPGSPIGPNSVLIFDVELLGVED